MLSESQSANRKQAWAETNALAEFTTEAAAKALALVTETKLVHYHPGLLSEFTPQKTSTLNIFLPFEFKT